MLDEHGMPVPCDPTQDPDGFFEYGVHATKWQVECREIVRRLAEWDDSDSPTRDVVKISIDAAKLWAKMQEEAKGGDGETSL